MGKGLRPNQRIRRTKTFVRLAKKGKLTKGTFLFLWECSQKETEKKETKTKTMFGVSVSRAVFKQANKRNRLKRCAREVFRNVQNELIPNKILLIRAKKGITLPGAEELKKDMINIFKRAGVLKE